MNGKRCIIKKQTKTKANQMAHASPLKLIISQNSLTSGTQKDMLELRKLCKPCCFNKLKWIKVHKPKSTRTAKNNTYAKIIKTQTPIFFTRKDARAKRVYQWALQQKAYFETQAIVADINWPRMTQSLFQNHAMEWCMAQKDVR